MTDIAIILIAIVGFLTGALVMFTVLSKSNRLDEDPPTRSPDEWWRDAERIKAAVEAAHREGIERARMPKLED